MWTHIVSLTIVTAGSTGITIALFVAAVRAVRREDEATWIGSPTLNGSPGGRRSGKLRRAA